VNDFSTREVDLTRIERVLAFPLGCVTDTQPDGVEVHVEFDALRVPRLAARLERRGLAIRLGA
jgi:hypothetical protein